MKVGSYTHHMRKNFNQWNKVKKKLDEIPDEKILPFREREIWWCSVGQNIGFEIYGKGDSFARPVLILKKHNPFTFYGLPLGSTRKKNPYHFLITTDGQEGSILLSQGRTFSSNRLLNRMVKLPKSKFSAIKQAYKSQY